MHTIELIFGEGKELTALNMGCRAIVVYLIVLLLIRISGMRTFGQQSAFDTIIVITMGALLSRPIVGASDFLPTVFAGFTLALLHRSIAWLTIRYQSLRKIFKGQEISLYKDGKINMENMRKCLISEGDLMASVRLHANLDSLVEVKEAVMERTGEISIVKK
ncbi:MAG: hypothetical protein JWQ28_2636 [Pedobacter sp.]|jgi:uncharacterized membrane protein YcaP (DUF421 family)|nr:hypothetical protein [Pedobacter sp.]